MSFFEHLAELRRRLLVSVVAVLLASVLCYLVREPVFAFLKNPLPEGYRLHFVRLVDPVLAYLKASLVAGLLTASPIVIYQLWAFILPALRVHERRVLFPGVLLSLLLFFLGAAFAFFYFLPFGIRFLLRFGEGPDLAPILTVSEYLSFCLILVVLFGLMFQLPLLMTVLARLGAVHPRALRKRRREVIVGLFILAAVLTPPDPITQVCLALPLLLLYEVGIWGAAAAARARAKALEGVQSAS